MKNKVSINILLILFGLLVIGGGSYWYVKNGHLDFFVSKENQEIISENNTSTSTLNQKQDNLRKEIVSTCIKENNNEYYRDYSIANCIEDKAVDYENYSYCELQSEYRPEKNKVPALNSCISKVAFKLGDLSKCSNLSKDPSVGTSASCYYGIALKNKDLSICDYIEENEYRSKYYCERNVLLEVAKTNPKICDSASNEELKLSCMEVFTDYKDLNCPLVKYNSYYFSELGKTFYYPLGYKPWLRDKLLSFVPVDWNIENQNKGAYPILYSVSSYDGLEGYTFKEDVKKALDNSLDYHSDYMENFEADPSKIFVDKTGTYSIDCSAVSGCDKQICDYIIKSVE